MAQTIYTAKFKNGMKLIKTDAEFDSRLAFYNWICMNGLGKLYGGVVEINCRVLP